MVKAVFWTVLFRTENKNDLIELPAITRFPKKLVFESKMRGDSGNEHVASLVVQLLAARKSEALNNSDEDSVKY